MDRKSSSKINQDNAEEMKKGQTSSTDHLPSEDGGERLTMLLDTVEGIFQDQEKCVAVSDSQMRKLKEDIEKYSKNEEKLRDLVIFMMRDRKFDVRILELKDEQEALKKRIIAHKLQLADQEISSLKYLITTMTGVVVEDDIPGKKLIDEMKERLKNVEAYVESLKL